MQGESALDILLSQFRGLYSEYITTAITTRLALLAGNVIVLLSASFMLYQTLGMLLLIFLVAAVGTAQLQSLRRELRFLREGLVRGTAQWEVFYVNYRWRAFESDRSAPLRALHRFVESYEPFLWATLALVNTSLIQWLARR
jgi:hypothetical protein